MARRRKGSLPGVSFSWKRATGVSAAKGKLSRRLGVPLTRQGRQRRFGRAAGCCVPLLVVAGGGAGVLGLLYRVVAL
jgi:hypothetical protein